MMHIDQDTFVEVAKQSVRFAQQRPSFNALNKARGHEPQFDSISSQQTTLHPQMDQDDIDCKSLPSHTGLVRPSQQH
jgi:hypothetical protein